jgi:hypothetical protein
MISASAAGTASRWRSLRVRAACRIASRTSATTAAGVLATPITIAAQPAITYRFVARQMIRMVTSVAVKTSAL